MNIHSAIIEGTKILKDKYISTARLDSEILLAKTINKDRKYVLLNLHKNFIKYNNHFLNDSGIVIDSDIAINHIIISKSCII